MLVRVPATIMMSDCSGASQIVERFWERESVPSETYLTGRRTENDTETILIVTSGGHVHHLDGTARESEGLNTTGNSRE